jgi:hypothetical protein
MAGWRLKKDADGPKRLARTLAPPTPLTKSANKNRKTCFIQSKFRVGGGGGLQKYSGFQFFEVCFQICFRACFQNPIVE